MPKLKEISMPYQPHPGQLEFHEDGHRFRVLCNGRRWGKTTCAISEMGAMLSEAKEPKPIGWVVAPNYPLIMVDWDEALAQWEQIILSRNVQDHWLELALGGGRVAKVEFKSAEKDEQGLLGRGLSALIVDEAKLVSQRAWDYGLRPALSDKQGRAVFISTPKGKGFFYELYRKGVPTDSQYHPDWRSWHFPTNTNPYFPASEWDELKATQPEMVFRQEYLAEFLEDAGEVFHSLAALPTCGLNPVRDPSRQYVVAVDLARTIDWTVILVMNDLGQVIHVNRSKELSWSVQKGLIRSIYEQFAPARVVLDSSGLGDVIEDDVRKMGIPTFGVKTGAPNQKEELVEGLQVAIEQARIALPDISWLKDELQEFTYEQLPSGHIRYSAPPGKHDDGVIALALAVHAFHGSLGRLIQEPVQKSKYTTLDEWKRLTDPKRKRAVNRWGQPVMPYVKLKVVLR